MKKRLKNSNNVVIDIDNGETCIVEFEYNNKVSTEGVIKNRKILRFIISETCQARKGDGVRNKY